MKNIVFFILIIVIALCLAGPAASKTESDINTKVSQLDIDTATLDDVIRIFGEPMKYSWSGQTFTKDNLPRVYIAQYPNKFSVVMVAGRVDELRFESLAAGYLFRDKIQVGSSLDEVLEVVGQPRDTVVAQALRERKMDSVLYKDVDGRKGFCYYSRSDRGVRFFFTNYKVNAIYVTRSDSGRSKSSGGSFQTVQPIKSVKAFDDVRWKDMSKLDFSKKKGLASTLTFNQKTVWPEQAKLPASCDPDQLLKEGMNPGLGIRKLHLQGITGKGVNVAIIDQPIHLDHPEFAGKVVAYHDVGCGSESSMHGPAVTSLLVGTNCGTAPGARVYYVAAPSWTKDAAYYAEALYWIIEQNEGLSGAEKIRVVSVSAAPSGPGSPFEKHNRMWERACRRAEAAGILVLDCTTHHGFIGACWYDANDPENVSKCTPGFRGRGGWGRPGCILVPTSPRTTAEEYDKGEFGYQYCGRGGLSWAIPYCAGVLALGWQVNPELSFEQMRDFFFQSAYVKETGEKIISPKDFVNLVRRAKAAPRRNQRQKISRVHSETNIIILGLRVGDYKLDMSKDDVLESLGKPKAIFHRGEKYTLNNLPKKYFMVFDDISFGIVDDSVKSIDVLSPLYKFANGLGVGDSEQKIKQTFGDDFLLKETEWKDFLIYENEGLQFEIHKKNRTVMEFTVTKKISLGHRISLAKPIKSVKPYDDVRWKDLSKLDLSRDKRLIHSLTFNKLTVWPKQAKMPLGGDPNKILTDALNPGLGIRELHQQGVTGKGVNVAIIDQPVYLVHPEFAGKIVEYYDTGCETDESSMHGPLVTSLLVGTNCGTAPDARVYYAAAPSWKMDSAYYAKGLNWIIEQNKNLPASEKIRVVSVSASPNQPSWANRQMWDRACARAEAVGIMVLDCTDSRQRGFIGRCWYNAKYPESLVKCNPWAPPNREFSFNPNDNSILVPSSPRTAAEDGGVPGYQYAGRGGRSRAIPYCAGVLAMGWQVNPKLSPEQIRELLYKSAFTKRNGAKIINPKDFIHLVRRAKAAPKTKRR